MKKKILLIIGLGVFIGSANSQLLSFDNEAISKDFVYNLNIYADGFIGPFMGNYSASQVASNHITAKTLKPFAIGIGISGSATMVSNAETEFNFNDKPFSNKMELSNPTKPILPSILGGNTTAELVYNVEDNSGIYTNPYEQNISALDGFTSPNNSIPAAALNVNVGLPLKTEVYVRALPKIVTDGLETYLIGGGVKHVVSQYFQEDSDDKHLNIAIAGFVGQSRFSFAPEKFLEGEGQEIVFTDNTQSAELIASYDKKLFSVFGLVGFYSGSSEFAINGTYRYEVNEGGLIQEAFEAKDPVNIKRDVSGIQTQFGASVNFSHFGSFALSYAMAENNSLAFNLRFYINNGE